MPSTVLLTGGNGFIAAHILALLLSRGHTVVTTVRSEDKTVHLRQKFAEPVGKGQLTFAIVKDNTSPGAFDEVLKSSSFDAVLHTSSPYDFSNTDAIKDLLNSAIAGITEILKSIKVHGRTVKRVVLTSSFGSIVNRDVENRPGYLYSEKDWNPITFEEALKDPASGYYGSKTLTEKAAWDFVTNEKPAFELTAICPPLIYGPALQEIKSMSNLSPSSADFYAVFSGQSQELTNQGVWLWTDVRNVAQAHVAALEKPEAAGERFLISEGRFKTNQVIDYIWKHYPERAQAKGVPKWLPSGEFPEAGTYSSDNSKSKNILGIEYIPFETTLKDTLEQFIDLEKEFNVE